MAMADPATLGLTLAGTAASGALTGLQGSQKAAALGAQAGVDRQEASNAGAIGSQKSYEEMRKGDYLGSTQNARAAASGGGTGGSSAAVMAATKGRAAYNAALQQWGGAMEAHKFNYEADIADSQKQQQEEMTPLQVGSTILTGLTNGQKAFAGTGNWLNQNFGTSI
jgi:hypothetical protein